MTTVPRFRFQLGYDPCNPTTPRQNQQKLTFIRPWSRFQNPCLDFDNVTRSQLQMRGKAEILQYKRKHVQMSRAEQQALAARKNYSKKNYVPKAHIDENGNLVPGKNTSIVNGAIVFDSKCNQISVNQSTASDVPGPPIDLFLDPSVPLIYTENPPRIYRAGGTSNVNNVVNNPENAINL